MQSFIEILFDEGSVLAVRKPAGLATQAPNPHDSLEQRLRQQLAARTRYIAFPHRLDRPVSGVILVALSKRVARLLGDQFASRKTTKNYLAWVHGKPDGEPKWQDFVRKVDGQALAECCDQAEREAKHADTNVEILHHDRTLNRTLLRLNPITGRMHQLRVQAARRGHPIVGDALYGYPGSPTSSDEEILLHADSLEFHHPKTAKCVKVTCPDERFRFS